MTDQNDDASLAESARALTASVEAMDQRLDDLTKSDGRRRKQMALVVAGLILDVLMSIVLGVVAYYTSEATEKASKGCEVINKSNKDQLDLWNYAFTFPPPVNETPEAKAQREKTSAEFQAYINRVFAHKDC